MEFTATTIEKQKIVFQIWSGYQIMISVPDLKINTIIEVKDFIYDNVSYVDKNVDDPISSIKDVWNIIFQAAKVGDCCAMISADESSKVIRFTYTGKTGCRQWYHCTF